MQENVRAQLPHKTDVRDFSRNQCEPLEPPDSAAGDPSGNYLQNENSDTGYADGFDRARKVLGNVESVSAVAAPEEGHL